MDCFNESFMRDEQLIDVDVRYLNVVEGKLTDRLYILYVFLKEKTKSMLIITADIYKFSDGCFPSNVSEHSHLTHNESLEPETPLVNGSIRCKINFPKIFSKFKQNTFFFTILTHFHL